MPEPYGSFSWICEHAPLPPCNFLFRAAWSYGRNLDALFPSSSDFFAGYNITSASNVKDAAVRAARDAAGTGIAANCMVPHVGHGGVGDVALVVVSLMSVALAAGLITKAWSNAHAVGRIELTILLSTFALHSALQAVTQSSMLQQGAAPLLILSAVHCAVIAMLVWVLLCNSVVLHDGYDGMRNLYTGVVSVGSAALFGGTLYIALATGYGWTSIFSTPDPDFSSIGLFTLTLVWPAFALVAAFAITYYVAEHRMHEREPALWLFGSAVVLLGGQAVLFFASQPLCEAANRKINGAFIAAILDAVALTLYYRAWDLIGAASWSLTQPWQDQRAMAYNNPYSFY